MPNDGGAEGFGRPFDRVDPRRELAVPDEGVAAEGEVVFSGEVGYDVTLGEVEDALFGFGEEPLPNTYVS